MSNNRNNHRGSNRGRGGRRSNRRRGGNSGKVRDVRGLMELTKNDAGKLHEDGIAQPNDPVVPKRTVSELGLRAGDMVEGVALGNTVKEVRTVNGRPVDQLKQRPHFDDLTAVHPEVPITLGTSTKAITGRVIDLVAPVGRGQRGLIVAPPKVGKTTILHDIAKGVAEDPDVDLIACLVAERPEEATELRRAIDGMVLAADLDRPAEDHTRVAELGVEHAKRLAEEGRHVVVLIDSLTRLARAYNLSIKGGGRTMSGGLDAAALLPVRKIFGAARATEEAGSVTIIATCLVDTGSRLDDVVYEEFKGTGNMELVLDRKLADKRLFPAINIERSGTRREELLLDPETLEVMRRMRRKLAGVDAFKALSALLKLLQRQVTDTEMSRV